MREIVEISSVTLGESTRALEWSREWDVWMIRFWAARRGEIMIIRHLKYIAFLDGRQKAIESHANFPHSPCSIAHLERLKRERQYERFWHLCVRNVLKKTFRVSACFWLFNVRFIEFSVNASYWHRNPTRFCLKYVCEFDVIDKFYPFWTHLAVSQFDGTQNWWTIQCTRLLRKTF